jgi:Lon protease-like protein
MPVKEQEKALRVAVESLRTLSPRLNSITDFANDLVREVEEFLNEECSIGISATVSVARTSDGPEGLYLEYRRVGPRFRVAVVLTDDEGNDISVKPWSDSSRTDKLGTLPFLPKLLTEIAEEAEGQVARAEKAAQTVASTLAALRGPAKPVRG